MLFDNKAILNNYISVEEIVDDPFGPMFVVPYTFYFALLMCFLPLLGQLLILHLIDLTGELLYAEYMLFILSLFVGSGKL